jgi:hypothetical protein
LHQDPFPAILNVAGKLQEANMNRTFTLYTDQLQRIIDRVEQNAKKNPLAVHAITMVVSDDDRCLKLLQQAGHDWIYLDEEQICEYK